MRSTIRPRAQHRYSGRHLDCLKALEETFHSTLQQARMAGWVEGEVAVILRHLANEHLEWMLAEADTEASKSAQATILGLQRS